MTRIPLYWGIKFRDLLKKYPRDFEKVVIEFEKFSVAEEEKLGERFSPSILSPEKKEDQRGGN
jgi:hypothetical protein